MKYFKRSTPAYMFNVSNTFVSIKHPSLISLLYLFLPLPSYALTQDSIFNSNNVITFLLGMGVPIFSYFCWRLIGKKINKQAELSTLQNRLNEDNIKYPHDLATNLPIAQYAIKKFDTELKANKDAKLVAVVFKPVNFQQVNTILGHHNSDILLLQLAFCLKEKANENTNLLSFESRIEPIRLARLQGLDFLVVFDSSNSKHGIKNEIDNLCQQLAYAVPNAMSFKSFSLNFELAFGVAISGEHGNSVEEIVSHATDALLIAVENGRTVEYFDNQTVLYTEQQLRLMETLSKDILAENFRWYLQPQVNIDNNAIIGFELKVNWCVKENEPLQLEEFIDLAEHSGEVYLLTKQMFKQAFKSLASLQKLRVFNPVSVNLSSQNLLEPDLIDYIEQLMKESNILGKYLMIELNENVMLSACHKAKSTIDQLKSLDITISINNFSGSYESLRYLRKMAIHQIKINCQDLGGSEDNRADKAIINALITFTRSMKLPLIGTNINKHETVQSYIAMGGTLVQGNIINKGIIPGELEIWLKRWFQQHPQAKPTE